MEGNLDVWSYSNHFVTMRGLTLGPSSYDKAVKPKRWREHLSTLTPLTWPCAQTSCSASLDALHCSGHFWLGSLLFGAEASCYIAS